MQGIGDQYARAIAVAPDGDVVAGGYFSDRAAIAKTTLKSAGRQDIWLARFGPDGEARWSIRLGGEGRELLSAIAVTQQGATVVGLDYDGDAPDVGGGLDYLREARKAGIRKPLVLITVGADGSQLRATALPIEGVAEGIVALPDGDLVVTTRAKQTADKACRTSTFVVTRLRPDGSTVWMKCSDQQTAFAPTKAYTRIATAPDGSLAVCGSFAGRTGWADTKAETKPGVDETSAFIISMTPTGAIRWVRYAYGGYLECKDVAVVAEGAITALFSTVPNREIKIDTQTSPVPALVSWSSDGKLLRMRSCPALLGVDDCEYESITSGNGLVIAARLGQRGLVAEISSSGQLIGTVHKTAKGLSALRLVRVGTERYGFIDVWDDIDMYEGFGKVNAHVGVFASTDQVPAQD